MNKNPARIWRESKKLSDKLGRVGRVLTFTKIYSAPSGFEHQIPYTVGIIELEDGQRMATEIVDCSPNQLKIGLKVQTVIRRIGQSEPEELIEYGIKAKPLK